MAVSASAGDEENRDEEDDEEETDNDVTLALISVTCVDTDHDVSSKEAMHLNLISTYT